MPNHCYNSLLVTNLHPDQKKQILDSFVLSESDQKEVISHFLATLCPEPDYTITPVADTFPHIQASFEMDAEELVKIFCNEPIISDNSWYEWRLQNWGTKWELYDVSLVQDSTQDQLSFTFATAWSPPCEGLFSISKRFPNALFQLQYQEPGDDFCGVSFFKNGIAFDHVLEISAIKNLWLQEHHPDLYARTQEECAEEDSDLDVSRQAPWPFGVNQVGR